MQISGVTSSAASMASSGLKLWDSASNLPSFDDFIDLINPLQHIPVISHIYQQETGDTMGAVAKVAGAAVLGGPVGGAIALANEVVDAITGNDVTGHLLGFMGIEKPNTSTKTEIVIPQNEEDIEVSAQNIRTTTKEWIYGKLA